MKYEPNSDGACWFAETAFRLVRQRFPGARFRVVGAPSHEVQALSRFEGVEVAGHVASMRSELEGADMAIVPIRFGADTRIKILESFAYGVPVVSTSVGAEGLEVQSGRELLIADDPTGLAAACIRVLEQPRLAEALADAGRRTWYDHYRWHAIRTNLAEILRERVGRPRIARGERP